MSGACDATTESRKLLPNAGYASTSREASWIACFMVKAVERRGAGRSGRARGGCADPFLPSETAGMIG